MIRGDRLVIPMNALSMCHSYSFGDRGFSEENVPRIELSLDECESILEYLPLIVEFVARNRQQKDTDGIAKKIIDRMSRGGNQEVLVENIRKIIQEAGFKC